MSTNQILLYLLGAAAACGIVFLSWTYYRLSKAGRRRRMSAVSASVLPLSSEFHSGVRPRPFRSQKSRGHVA